MVELDIQPGQTATTTDPVVAIRLPAGRFFLFLVVVTKDGRRSQPAMVELRSGPDLP
jgi:hypothetical protein